MWLSAAAEEEENTNNNSNNNNNDNNNDQTETFWQEILLAGVCEILIVSLYLPA